MSDESKYCSCNESELETLPDPLFRLVCHCKTCQQFFDSPYNDECTFILKDCPAIDLEDVELKGYQKGYSPIKRGKCKRCGKISYCTIKVGPFPEFLMVPTERLKSNEIPEPFAHIYYSSRQRDLDTQVRKIGGHFLSQLAIMWVVLKSLIRGRQA